jgi:alpha-beta hydrolase superfamily lysophospholipase
MNARPTVFDCEAGPCFGWFHPAAQPARSTVVVMCRPIGYEALCSYRTYTQLAETLARAGFDVLRFDYHGTGDSAGVDEDPARAHAWLASILAAIRHARRCSGAAHVALFGLRLGATLAIEASSACGGVESLMLWAPCASGRAFTREMRAAAATENAAPEGVEALGTWFTPQTLGGIEELAAAPTAAPARNALLVSRDDIPGEGPLPRRLRALGVDVTFTVWPGYAGMMAEPHEAVLAEDTLDSITQWLCARHPTVAAPSGAEPVPEASSIACGAVVETPVHFGIDGGLFGLLSQASTPARGLRGDTAVVMLNVGGNYRIGPNRNYVKAARELAAAGYRVLRFDVSGIGDSRAEAGFTGDSMYRDWATVDVSAAIDMLAARGCRRFYLMGICSGSYLAFQTALKDPRVTGVVLMNSRLLEWDAEKNGPWQSSMQRYYKSTRYYRHALLRWDVYARLLRGRVDVRGIAGRMLELAQARAVRTWDRIVLRREPRDGVLAKFRHLSRQGVQVLVAMSENDDGLDYMEFHLGANGARMNGYPGFRFVLIPQADHTFTTVRSQRNMIEQLGRHLDELHDAGEAGAVRPVGHSS